MTVDPADRPVLVNFARTEETKIIHNQQRPQSQDNEVPIVRQEPQYPLHPASTVQIGKNLRTRLFVSSLDYLRGFVVQ